VKNNSQAFNNILQGSSVFPAFSPLATRCSPLSRMSFEDLEVWKRSARLSATLYQQTKDLRDYGFRDQLTRSGLSIPSNIAEGFERDSNAEIARFLTIAKGSAGELRTQILIGIEAGYIEREPGLQWVDETRQIGRILGALIKRHRNNKS
jgi:four helix bundle protein